MWRVKQTPLSNSTKHFSFLSPEGTALTFRDVIDLWASDAGKGSMFRLFTCLTLASSHYAAFRFETPQVTLDSTDRIFEFVLIDSPSLNRKENPRQFSDHFASSSDEQTVVRFSSLGNDATLVAPCPGSDNRINHCHLGSFLRTADQVVCIELWKQVGMAMNERLSDRPAWLNTAGGGVAWLHVRIDDRPKYYSHSPFKTS